MYLPAQATFVNLLGCYKISQTVLHPLYCCSKTHMRETPKDVVSLSTFPIRLGSTYNLGSLNMS